MEQIVKSILKEQGFEHISLFDKDKDVWIYIKDREVHFCKSDLSPIDRETIGINQKLIILTESADSIHVVKDDGLFSNFIIIDENNKILVQARLNEREYYSSEKETYIKESFLIVKFKDGVFLIVSNKHLDSCALNKCNSLMLSIFQGDESSEMHSYLFSENKYLENYYLCSFYHDFYFFKKNSDNMNSDYIHTIISIKKGEGFVSKEIELGEWGPYLWMHKDRMSQIVTIEDGHKFHYYGVFDKDSSHEEIIESGIVKIWTYDNWRKKYYESTYRASEYVTPNNITGNLVFDYDYLNRNNTPVSDEYIVLPFLNKLGVFVITYKNEELFAHVIIFEEDEHFFDYSQVELHGRIIVFEKGTTSLYYDIWGNKLVGYEDLNKNYLIFTDRRNLLLSSRIEETKGIIDTRYNEIVVPPIFKDIIVINDEYGLFEVTYCYSATYLYNGQNIQHETKGLYSVWEGYVIPFGSNYEFPQYNNFGFKLTDTANRFAVYINENKKGLIYKAKKVLGLQCDDISGFCFNEDFKDEPKSYYWDIEMGCNLEQKKEYSPLCVILRDNNKFGLFYGIDNLEEKDYEIIHPDFDDITCIKVFNKHAYFKVEKGGIFGVICDDILFNNQNTIQYDNVEYEVVIDDNCYFTVVKNGKTGAICTNDEYNIPTSFEDIDYITRSGVICNKVLYNRKGEVLFSLGEKYHYLKTKCYDVFTSKDDYVIINLQGNKLNYIKDENDDHILYIEGSSRQFDVIKGDFIEEDNGYYYDPYSEYTRKELDDMYREAYEGDPEAQWNTD